MNVSVVTQDLALQLEQAKADDLDSWFQSMGEQNSQVFKNSAFQAKGVRAFCAQNMQAIGLFNQIIGLGPHNKELLQEVMHFYREQGVATCRVEVNPYWTTPDFLAALAEAGFSVSRFETSLYVH